MVLQNFNLLCRRTMLIVLETVAVILLLVLLAGGGLLWRLTSGPFDLAFAKDHIQQALQDPTSGYSVTMEQVVLNWSDLRAPLTLEIRGMQLIKDSNSVLQVDRLDLGLAGLPLVLGQIEPSRILLYKPSLHLVRMFDGSISLGVAGVDIPAPVEDDDLSLDNTGPLMRIVRRLSQPQEEIDDRSPLDHLQSLEIEEAQMVMEDHILGVTWFLPKLDLLFARQKDGLVISSALDLPGGRDGAASIRADLAYNRVADDFRLQAYVQDFDPHILSSKIEKLAFLNDHDIVLNGDIKLLVNSDLKLQEADILLRSEAGFLTLDGVYDRPLAYEALVVDALYDADKDSLNIKEISVTAKDIKLALSSMITMGPDKIEAPISLIIADLPQSKIAPVWPDVLRGEPIEDWLLERLSKGRIHDATVTFGLTAQKNEEQDWKITARDIAADFGIENMDIDYRAPLMPVTEAYAKAHFSGDILVIDVMRAKLDDLTISKARIEIDHIIAAGVGTALIDVSLNGPLQTVFRYVAPEPISMDATRLGFNPATVKGRAALDVNLSFPTSKTLRTDQVEVTVNGMLSDIFLPDVVKDMDLTGGPLALKVDDGKASLRGKAFLAQYPVDMSWQQFLKTAGKPYESKITAKMEANKELRHRLGLDLSDWLAGTLPVDVTYTEFGGGRAEAAIIADVTPSILMIAPFDFEKQVGAKGEARCKVVLQNGAVKEVRDLNINSVPLHLSGGDFYFRQENGEDILARGTVKQIVFEENDMALEFEVAPSGLLKMALEGAFLDARPFLKGKKEGGETPHTGPALQASIAVERLRTHPARILSQAKIYLDMDVKGGINQLEMDAQAGEGDFYFRFKPDESGKMTVRMEADDAGATLRAFDLYDNVKGGKLVLYGEAPNRFVDKLLVGHMELHDFHVIQAPVLARLFSGIGPTGIPQMLGGEGIYFGRLESDFEWSIRPQGDLYRIREGRTSGSSLGVTFDGKIDKEEGTTDIVGTIVPMSMINQFISHIPIIGDILAGGKGGAIFAATYTVKGPSDEPEIAVNPLSILTPGILRKILFEGEVDE